jgi:O-methyltransferase
MTSVEQRINMFHLVSQVLAYDVEGGVVELGCHEGQSSVLIQKIIIESKSSKEFHIFDSFEGLPPPDGIDGSSFKKGELTTTERAVMENFAKHNLPVPKIHKGWFSDTLPKCLPRKICFAYLDGDFYESILTSLKYVYPRLTKGAICLIDDYCDPDVNPNGWNLLPGVKKACDEFLADKPEKIANIYAGPYSHGFFRKI